MPPKLGQQQRRGPGRGSLRKGKIRQPCEFEPETFEEIRSFAIRENISLAETIRTLIQWGLDAEN